MRAVQLYINLKFHSKKTDMLNDSIHYCPPETALEGFPSHNCIQQMNTGTHIIESTVKPVKNGQSKKEKKGFQDQLSLNAGQKYCSILQYFRPSLSYYLSLRSLFCLFLSGRFTQVLLYIQNILNIVVILF